ncbi:MAG: phosphate/phosphite/phosphonate ABC transporter substrate-binding protein [Euryarchaeota archaeon]|nr:phosphate/phosphite/phosphonate ABC transporter substrate-binding protein [Euryarchaeota archaeon]MDE1835653.1 phosphate/phosphite/phosphonate ABC transporter substrate-binding protein [Euryarchaeota archaeon]MDE1879001.1 phosphate/phosphite/phosphonate ABC transporter substrate-binding protein [Euryarchaeota archaeon]MDE2043725.1 phosphate/phosphite/phosphonate ABC transporter substrate-binding protein [Thermoplasmata archaeon]
MAERSPRDEPLRVGAVAYDPKVVAIWEGMQAYLRDEARLPVEVELFLSYPAQVRALLAGRVDIAWNTNLAYLQAEAWSSGACRPLGMRDTDLGWRTFLLAPSGGEVSSPESLRERTLALGSRDSGHASILPVHYLARSGLSEGKDYRALRFDTDVGKHGDTGTSEVEVLKAVLDGRAAAGAVGSPFWKGVQEKGLVPQGALHIAWESPAYSHCMFTGRPDLEPERGQAFTDALAHMNFDDPHHRAILEAEGLRRWLPPHAEGYDDLRQAAREQGLLDAPG